MAGSSMGELRAPIFNGSNYDFWRIKMCTIFKSHKLWDMVENGYEQSVKKEEGEALTTAQKLLLEENVAKDAKALGLIQGAVSDDIFPRIALKDQLRSKLEDAAEKCIFVGYGKCEKGYRVYNLQTNKVTTAAPNVDSPSDSPSSTPVKLRDITEIYARCNMSIIEPENFAEASKDKAWQKAMEIEMEMIEKNETWELVDRPSDKPVIGIDFNETFAPVARLDTIRTLIALAAQKGWKLYQLGVKSAFLNKEEVYVDQPDGFVTTNYEDKVYKLKKALYGLKQAPRAWYEEINAYLISCGYVRSTSEATLYCKTKEDSGTLIVSIYVDDIVYTDSSGELFEDFKTEIMRRYEMTDLGLLYHFLATRPDIMFAASLLARFMHCPTKKHYGTAKRVLRYIQGTIDFGIEYQKGKEAILIGYCDSDWSGSQDDMRSTSGYAFSFGSGPFSWA
ncbi:hypothetical protein L3X38_037746 [Prunus dulcis]|uniref:Reverse transcriptase Ty1/copia-type domain-containing protein n=1 Tax=Prunus dulcis TaxID=3755 RepID=A0AAD4YRI3_PRUDU|nr:hypothetical protein L3X38_037746 [Prunus dulcis]